MPGLPHWVDVVEDFDTEGRDAYYASCRCGWYEGPFYRHPDAAGYGRRHRAESPMPPANAQRY
jgi:hypothetical protein